MAIDSYDIDRNFLDQPQQQKNDQTKSEIQEECKSFFELAGVEVLVSISFSVAPLLTASYIGRNFAPVYLSAFTLANLTGNAFIYALLTGLMTASDTLSPQAYGKEQYEEVGRIAIRGFFACAILLLPITLVLYYNLEFILINYFGQDSEASMYAQQWYQIYSLGIFCSILYDVIWKFLTAQHVMKPLIVVSTFATCIILPINLHYCIKDLGFIGSAYAYIVTQIVETLLLVLYIFWYHPHDSRTWPVTTIMNTMSSSTSTSTSTHQNTKNKNNNNLVDFCKSSLQLNPTKEFLYLGKFSFHSNGYLYGVILCLLVMYLFVCFCRRVYYIACSFIR